MSLPFTCAECGIKFPPERGGKGSQCGRILFDRHARMTKAGGPMCWRFQPSSPLTRETHWYGKWLWWWIPLFGVCLYGIYIWMTADS